MSPGSSVLFGAIPPELKFSTEDKRVLRSFARDLARRVADGAWFTCLIADDRELRRLNKQFLGHDYATDVLSFPAGDGADAGALGEIAISAERADEQARAFGHTLRDEIQILMLHGVLHLTGLDHERDRGEMAQAEERWRAEFGLPAALIERAGSGAAAVERRR